MRDRQRGRGRRRLSRDEKHRPESSRGSLFSRAFPLAFLSRAARARAQGDAPHDEFTYPIEGRLSLPDRSRLATTALTLNGGQYATFTRADGGFTFHDVAPGVCVRRPLPPLLLRRNANTSTASINTAHASTTTMTTNTIRDDVRTTNALSPRSLSA